RVGLISRLPRATNLFWEPGAGNPHAGFCSVCGDKALLPCVALSRRGALRVLALGPTVPRSGTCEPAVLFGRPPASTQLRARQGNRATSNRCVARVALNSAPNLAGPETAHPNGG